MPSYHPPGTRKGNKTWIVRGYVNRKQRECITPADTRAGAEDYWLRWAAELERIESGYTSWVYVIQCTATKRIKIGVSKDPKGRLASLQCGSATELVLLGVIPGDRSDEQNIHRMLQGSRRHGEWFDWTDPVQGFLDWRLGINDDSTPLYDSRGGRPVALLGDAHPQPDPGRPHRLFPGREQD